MWQSIARTCSTIARTASGIFATISLLIAVPIAGLIFIVEVYRSLGRITVVLTEDPHRSAAGTGEDERS